MKLDHAKSIALIILLTITATSSATWYLTVHSLSAPTLPSYDYPGSGQNYWTYFIYQDTGGTWLRIRGDTRLQDDWSASDSPVTDPVPLINRAIVAMGQTDSLVIKGDFSSARTVLIGAGQKQIGGYYHYGKEVYTGSADAYFIDIAQAISPNQDSGLDMYINRLYGPGPASSTTCSGGTSVGLHIKNLVRSFIKIGSLGLVEGGTATFQCFNEGIKIDGTAGFTQVIADNQFTFGFVVSTFGIHFVGTSCGACFEEGNTFFGTVGSNVAGITAGIQIDTGVDACCATFTGTYDAGTNPTWINNSASVGISIFAHYFNDAGNNVYSGKETIMVAIGACVGSGTCGGYGNQFVLYLTPRYGEKQLGVSFTTATSKAVTFPYAQADTSYSVVVVFHQNSGAYWITSLATTGCTINWVTSSTGTLDYFVYR